jgi:hypothetical protein
VSERAIYENVLASWFSFIHALLSFSPLSDPFGHSSVTPSLWSLMGFEALVVNRIHHSLKDAFKGQKKMEFIWRGVDVGQKTDMFTHVLHTHYSAPPSVRERNEWEMRVHASVSMLISASLVSVLPCSGFDWEEGAMGIDGNNVASRARDFSNIMRSRASAYRTPHLLVPFGDDFKFKAADRQFGNMDRLIEHMNANKDTYGMSVRYSTLSDYFSAVASTSSVSHPVLTGDFFPYADNEDSYWIGYYTTRPVLKQKSRKLNHILRACESLLVLVRSSPHSTLDTQRRELSRGYWEEKFKEVERARMETALFLHHDAITGTSRTNVVQDYLSRMDSSSNQLNEIINRMMEHLLTKEPNPTPNLTQDEIVFTPPEQGQEPTLHPVLFYNSLGWVRNEIASVRVSSRAVEILDGKGEAVRCQVDATWTGLENDDVSPSSSVFLVSFPISLPALGAATYYVRMGKEGEKTEQSITTVYASQERKSRGTQSFKSKYLSYESHSPSLQSIENSHLKLSFSSESGLLSQVEVKGEKGKSFPFIQSFGKYSTSRSGAYIFRPQGRLETFSSSEPTTIRITRGKIVSKVQVKWKGMEVSVKLKGGEGGEGWEADRHVEISSSVSTESNSELICSFSSPGFNAQEREFFTNSGVDWIRRQSKDGNEAQNFYPAVLGARMVSRSSSKSYTVISSHSMAVGSNQDGMLEFMMHRSLAQDDGRGLAEPVHDSTRLEIPMWLSFGEGGWERGVRGEGECDACADLFSLSHSLPSRIRPIRPLLPPSLPVPQQPRSLLLQASHSFLFRFLLERRSCDVCGGVEEETTY